MKKFYKSKTVWFALLFGLVNVAGLVGYADYSPGTDVVEIVNVVVAAVTLLLRFVTKEPLEL
jgi:hypothetical protein